MAQAAFFGNGCLFRTVDYQKSWTGPKEQLKSYRLAVVDPIRTNTDPVGDPSVETSSSTMGLEFESEGVNDRRYLAGISKDYQHALQHASFNRDGAILPYVHDPDAPLPTYAVQIKPRIVQFDEGSKFLRMFPSAGAMIIAMDSDVIDSQTGKVIATAHVHSRTTGAGPATDFKDIMTYVIENSAKMIDEYLGPTIAVRSAKIVTQATDARPGEAATPAIARVASKKIDVDYPAETTTSDVELVVKINDPTVNSLDVASMDGRVAKKKDTTNEEVVRLQLSLPKGSNTLSVSAKNAKGESVGQVDIEITRHK